MMSIDYSDVYDDMNLYVTEKQFIIEPVDKKELLIVDRETNSLSVQPKSNQIGSQRPTRYICGILGTIRLIAGQYLIVATHRLYVGILNGATIWRLAGYDILANNPKNKLTKEQYDHNEKLLKMLRKTLDTKNYYFSYRYDLTHTLQRRHSMTWVTTRQSLLTRADKRFVWNGFILGNFDCDLCRFHLPLILGFISINEAVVDGKTFYWSIISRRSVQFAGTRFFTRGINSEGHAANYVETEQIIEYNGNCISFVQTRGSMPFYWCQLPNLRYKPMPFILSGKNHHAACKKHFDEQISLYGQQIVVNLVNQSGTEGTLEKAFATFIHDIDNSKIVYEAFDFHEECKKMQWYRLNILIDRLVPHQEANSMFQVKENGTVLSKQKGVFRTNCIDCLDRTNVVQSMLAYRALNTTLRKLGIIGAEQDIEKVSPQFHYVFQNIWADNADMISLQYSGTGALKTDFTRTGKRTGVGLLNDGCNSLTRYYLNNFADGARQDGINLLLGNYEVKETDIIESPLKVRHSWRYHTFPSMFVFAFAMICITASSLNSFESENMLFMLFWASMIGVTSTGIVHYGIEFVDWPRLLPLIKSD